VITSSQNPKIRLVQSLLTQRKAREEAGVFVIEGVRLCEEAAAARVSPQLVIHSADVSARGRKLLEQFALRGGDIEEVPAGLLASISDTETTQGILAVVPVQGLPNPKQRTFTVIADEIRDPGNLGSLIRSAAAAGVDEFFVTPGTADPYAPKVVRAGMGAHFHLPIRGRSWAHIQADVAASDAGRTRLILLADMAGVPMWDLNLTQPLALIIGGEAEGASEEAHHLATGRISIPMPGRSESLNAAVAGSILIFEVLRQRRQ
jgi:TrmH family RNA methyltransferase